MKNILILLITILLLSSCNNDKIENEEIGTIAPVEKEIKLSNHFYGTIITISHDNHQLILWLNGYGSQMIHHPSCKYCKKDTL